MMGNGVVAKKLTVASLCDCSRPLYVESDIEGVDYGQSGSCFLLRKHNTLWVATARHCLWAERKPNPETIRAAVERLWIPQRLEVTSPSSFGFTNATVGSSGTHAAASDIAVLEISGDPWPDASDFCDLSIVPMGAPNHGDRLLIAGYPAVISQIQYPEEIQEGKLRPRRLVATGSFVEDGTAPMLNAIALDEPNALASYNGMSGSPVFLMRASGSLTVATLAGIAVREMTSAGRIDFIPARVLVNVLDR